MNIKPGVLIAHIALFPLPGVRSLDCEGNMAGAVLRMLLESEISNYSGVFKLDMFDTDFCRLSKMSSCSLGGNSAN